jgi:predicted nucleic acid-binding protein
MPRGNPSTLPRVFLDSGVLLEGLLAPWSASRALLILSRRKVFEIILAEYVRGEVEDNLLELLAPDPRLANETIDAYSTLMRLLKPEVIPLPSRQEIDGHRHLIRHQADVPVLVSALKAAPDWFLTTNTRHFTKQVALRTQLKIVTSQEFVTSVRIPA